MAQDKNSVPPDEGGETIDRTCTPVDLPDNRLTFLINGDGTGADLRRASDRIFEKGGAG